MNRILLKPRAFAAVLFIAAHWGCSAGGALDPVDVPSLDGTSPSPQEAPEVPPSNPAGRVEIQFAANGTFLHNFNILDFRYVNKAKETALNTKMKGRYDEFYNSPETPICIKGINLTDVASYEVDEIPVTMGVTARVGVMAMVTQTWTKPTHTWARSSRFSGAVEGVAQRIKKLLTSTVLTLYYSRLAA